MLTLYHNGAEYPLTLTEYYVRELVSGLDEVIYNISIWDEAYAMMAEEDYIIENGGQKYLIKQIDAGANSAKVICQLDVDAWRATMHLDYSNNSATVYQTINNIKPTGWTVSDFSYINIRRTIEGNYTAFEICEACREVYSVYIRWDNISKTCYIYPQSMGSPVGAFATRQLNLKEINYKGKSTDFATRLYAYGKKDDAGVPLTFQGAVIGGEVYPYPYVENKSYVNKVVCAYWIDERYTVAQNLYDDAVEKLSKLSVPTRSYSCKIVDLKATNPELYGNMDFSLLTVATLIDDTKDVAVNYQVVERHIWRYHPDQNEVIFDNVPQKITNSVTRLVDAIENPNSTFQQIIDIRTAEATDWLTNADSHIYIKRNPTDGSWQELFFLDGTEDPSTATKVMRLNSSGLGFSKTGVNGPFKNAFVFDSEQGGALNADFITTGELTGNVIRAGTITSIANPDTYWDLDNGVLHISASDAQQIAQYVDAAGITLSMPYTFSGFIANFSAQLLKGEDNVTTDYDAGCYTWYKRDNNVVTYLGSGYTLSFDLQTFEYGGAIILRFEALELQDIETSAGDVLTDTAGDILQCFAPPTSEPYIACETDFSNGVAIQELSVTTEGLVSRLNNIDGHGTTMESAIAQSAHSISLTVSGSAGQQTAAGIEISLLDENGNVIDSADGDIYITGNVVFKSNLTDGVTEISGDNIKTGQISDPNNNTVFNLSSGALTMKKGSIYLANTSGNYVSINDGTIRANRYTFAESNSSGITYSWVYSVSYRGEVANIIWTGGQLGSWQQIHGWGIHSRNPDYWGVAGGGGYAAIYCSECVQYGNSSDINFKDDIKYLDAETCKDIVMGIKGISFVNKYDDTHRKRYGIIAQELKKIIDDRGLAWDIVNYNDQIQGYCLEYTELIPVLAMTIQELQKEIDEIKKGNA